MDKFINITLYPRLMNQAAKSGLTSALLIILIPIFWALTPPSLSAQSTTDPYHQSLLQQLQTDYGLSDGTWLFADNEQSNINSVGIYGRGLQQTTVAVGGQPFTQAVRLVQSEQPYLPWETGAVLGNQATVQAGDVVLLVVWVRSIEATEGSGYVRANFIDRTTFEEPVISPFEPSTEWQQIFIPFVAVKENLADTAIFSLQVGAMPQALEVGGMTGINYGISVEVGDLPRTVFTNYEGQEVDALWRAVADQRIEQHRKADLTVTVVDRNGTPIPDAAVNVQMQEHAFRFGSAVNIFSLLGTDADSEIYRSRLTDLDGNGNGFNAAVMEWTLQWLPWEGHLGIQYTQDQTVEAFSVAKDMGFTMRAHSLVWGGWEWLPPDMEQNQGDPAYLRQRIDERITTMLTEPRLAGQIFEWDVVNEPRFETDLGQALSGSPDFPTADSINPYIFQAAEQADPNMRLFINDYSILSEGALTLGAHQRYHEIIQGLLDSGARLDGIGLQSHMAYPLTPPERLYALLDEFAAYGRELHISEYDLEIQEEEVAGNYTRDFLTVIFSHPSVTGFTLWNIWDPLHWKQNAALFREDWSVKPSGAAIFELLFNQWWTEESGPTNRSGQFGTRAFLGSYQIEANYEDATALLNTSVVSGTNAVTITLDVEMAGDEAGDKAMIALVSAAPQIDGEVDGLWDSVPIYSVGKTILGDSATAADLSATFRLLTADGFLYALVEVTDDDLRNDSGGEWWEDDGIEIFLDGDRSAGNEYDGVNDAQLVFRWGDVAATAGPNSVPIPDELSYQMIQTENGYRLEAAIPASDLDLPLILGSQFGLDIHVIDDDSDGSGEMGRENKIAWAATEDEAWRNPTVIGRGQVRLGANAGFDAFIPLLLQ